MTITLFLQLQTLSTSVAVCSLAIFLLRKKAFTHGENIAVKTIAGWIAPFALLILLMSAHNRLDGFLLERLHPNGAAQAGIYAMAYRLLDACNMLGFLTASFLVPFLSRHRNNKVLVEQVLLLSRHGLLFFSAGVVAFTAVFAPWLQQVLYHSADTYSSTVIRLSLAVLPAYYLVHIYGSALTATANLRMFIQIVFLSVAANALLNLWLIPLYGALGCSIAALITHYSCGIALWVLCSRKLAIALSAGTVVLCAAMALLLGFFFYYGQKLTGNVWIILSSIALPAFVLVLTQRSFIKKLFLPFYQ
jgi:O-antigen/teichoic acid export membrane protein